MSINSVLKGCHDTLITSAARHMICNSIDHASMCDLQAAAVARLLEELEKEEEK